MHDIRTHLGEIRKPKFELNKLRSLLHESLFKKS
jgi:hypothetical protein